MSSTVGSCGSRGHRVFSDSNKRDSGFPDSSGDFAHDNGLCLPLGGLARRKVNPPAHAVSMGREACPCKGDARRPCGRDIEHTQDAAMMVATDELDSHDVVSPAENDKRTLEEDWRVPSPLPTMLTRTDP
eukprot:2868560-Rhodomonas_salina.1